jgi:hypothetical protein
LIGPAPARPRDALPCAPAGQQVLRQHLPRPRSRSAMTWLIQAWPRRISLVTRPAPSGPRCCALTSAAPLTALPRSPCLPRHCGRDIFGSGSARSPVHCTRTEGTHKRVAARGRRIESNCSFSIRLRVSRIRSALRGTASPSIALELTTNGWRTVL